MQSNKHETIKIVEGVKEFYLYYKPFFIELIVVTILCYYLSEIINQNIVFNVCCTLLSFIILILAFTTKTIITNSFIKRTNLLSIYWKKILFNNIKIIKITTYPFSNRKFNYLINIYSNDNTSFKFGLITTDNLITFQSSLKERNIKIQISQSVELMIKENNIKK